MVSPEFLASPLPDDRSAVVLRVEDKKVLVANLTITGGDDGSADIRPAGESDGEVEKIHLLLESIRGESRKEPLGASREDAVKKFRTSVISALKGRLLRRRATAPRLAR